MLLTSERKSRGWSQAELGRRACLNPNTISQIESRRFRPYPTQLEKLAKALGWPAARAEELIEEASLEREHASASFPSSREERDQ